MQGSLLLNSHCLLYKSAMEEVKIWGWPLQTAGLLTTGFSSKSFTILSGRVSEVNANLFTLVFFLINIKRTLRINLIVIAAACFGFASADVIINFLLFFLKNFAVVLWKEWIYYNKKGKCIMGTKQMGYLCNTNGSQHMDL